MIISGGVNIYPQETENLLITHPKVMDAAVIGVPNEDLGEEVKAVVQVMDGIEPGPELEQELLAFCRANLAHFKCPRTVDFEAELPRLPTGQAVQAPAPRPLLGQHDVADRVSPDVSWRRGRRGRRRQRRQTSRSATEARGAGRGRARSCSRAANEVARDNSDARAGRQIGGLAGAAMAGAMIAIRDVVEGPPKDQGAVVGRLADGARGHRQRRRRARRRRGRRRPRPRRAGAAAPGPDRRAAARAAAADHRLRLPRHVRVP